MIICFGRLNGLLGHHSFPSWCYIPWWHSSACGLSATWWSIILIWHGLQAVHFRSRLGWEVPGKYMIFFLVPCRGLMVDECILGGCWFFCFL